MNVKRIRIIAALILALVFVCSGCSAKKPEKKEPVTERETVRVMFPEGSTVSQIALLLQENRVCAAADFMAAANSAELAAEYGIVIPSPENRSFLLEGYLYPDTYDFYVGESAQTAIKRFLKNTQSKLSDEFKAECEAQGFTVDEILSLASVIQKEAGNADEMKNVSSVLRNRLESSRFPKLQCDVTIDYLEKYVKPYVTVERFEELRELYNTYKCKGLPEGPITNSGEEALYAALYPVESDWYFFISDSDGVYHYAETFEEHQENCERAGL